MSRSLKLIDFGVAPLTRFEGNITGVYTVGTWTMELPMSGLDPSTPWLVCTCSTCLFKSANFLLIHGIV